MGQHTQTHTASQNREINLGHQEVQRIIEELIQIYATSHSDWLPIEPVSMFLCTSLGYEDVNELEDALNGTFLEFLGMLTPIIETNSTQFRVIPDPVDQRPVMLTYTVTQIAQLFNVLFKSQFAKIKIPKLGLQFSVDGQRKIDTVYNYLATCVLDLSMYAAPNDQITQTIEQVGALCDVNEPWDLIVFDPKGISKFSDMSLVRVEYDFVDSDDD